MKRIFFWPLCSVCFCFLMGTVWATPSYRPPTETVGLKSMEFSVSGGAFDTTTHYKADGIEVPLVGAESFRKMETEFSAKYGITRPVELRMGLRYRRNTALVDDSERGQIPFSTEGVDSYFAGLKYNFTENPSWYFALDFFYRQSAITNEVYLATDRLRLMELGDQVKDAGGGLHITQKFRSQRQLMITYSTLYQYRSNDFSSEILYRIEAAYRGSALAFLLGAEGIHSLQTDPFTDAPATKPLLHTGPTNLWNSVNRSYLAPFVGFGWKVTSNWRLEGQFKRYLNGKSTDGGNEGLVTLSWQLPGVSDGQLHVESFKEYEVEATVVKVSPRGIFVKIDKGIGDDIHKGMVMDIFQFDYLGGNVLVATGTVYEVDGSSGLLKVQKRYQDIPIKVGFVVRGRLNE